MTLKLLNIRCSNFCRLLHLQSNIVCMLTMLKSMLKSFTGRFAVVMFLIRITSKQCYIQHYKYNEVIFNEVLKYNKEKYIIVVMLLYLLRINLVRV